MGALSVSVRVDEKSAADLSGPRRRCISIESATLSRCSCRHAANPWLTNKAGKQEAKEDDDERQYHGPGRRLSDRVEGRMFMRFGRVREANARAGGLSRGCDRFLVPPLVTLSAAKGAIPNMAPVTSLEVTA
jgi:hypothetical protein